MRKPLAPFFILLLGLTLLIGCGGDESSAPFSAGDDSQGPKEQAEFTEDEAPQDQDDQGDQDPQTKKWQNAFTRIQSKKPRVVGCQMANKKISVKGHTKLNPKCQYRQSLVIQSSNTVLDCQGALIRFGEGSKNSRYGILVQAKNMRQKLKNILVKNCRVDGFLNGVRVERLNFRKATAGQEYAQSTENIQFHNIRIHNAKGAGVFINAFVEKVSIRNSLVHGSNNAGVYLEAGSRNNQILFSKILKNGHLTRKSEHNEKDFGLFEIEINNTGREGIAVDGSRNNLIMGNQIEQNVAGGIFLYKNCGEMKGSESWFKRNYGANKNKIIGNQFAGQPVGVWIGSRQSENQYYMECSDRATKKRDIDIPPFRLHEDFAKRNEIRDNSFRAHKYSIRIEDDFNIIEGNEIKGIWKRGIGILIGTLYRASTQNKPLVGNRIFSNRVTSQLPVHQAYRWSVGIEDFFEKDNRFNGRSVSFQQGSFPKPNDHLFFKSFEINGWGSWFDF